MKWCLGGELRRGRIKTCGPCNKKGGGIKIILPPSTILKINKLRSAGYSIYRTARKLRLSFHVVRNYDPIGTRYDRPVEDLFMHVHELRKRGVGWAAICQRPELREKFLGHFKRIPPSSTLAGNYARREPRILQREQAAADIKLETLGEIRDRGGVDDDPEVYGAKAVAAKLGTTERRVSRLRNHVPKRMQKRIDASSFPFDFERVRKWYMDDELTWKQIREKLRVRMSSAQIERRFHAEADRRSGVTKI